ncbi:MAG: response regulator [Lachnospiraceae bacterium]|nr:response regulator [Lachnospiraceae bacterium]
MGTEGNRKREIFESAHLMVLLSYTVFVFVLIGETILMGWEYWAIPLLLISVLITWVVHIRQALNEHLRVWIYAALTMVTFFFYGIHLTSTYDIAAVMCAVMMLYTATDEPGLITLSLVTYYATYGYDILVMIISGEEFDDLLVSRSLLHILVITTVWWICRNIIKKWHVTMQQTDVQINELKDSSRRMDDFMVNISHEIRTPMNAVVGLSSVMVKESENKRQKDNLIKILDAGHRVSTQVSDILDHTEIDMGKLTVTNETYMLSSLVNDVIAQIQPIMTKKVELLFDIDTNIPASLSGDTGKIKKILWHLITNGIKFTEKGGVYVSIGYAKKPYGINLQIEVSDTGIGMDADEIERVSQRFYQSDSGRTRTAGGLGLGLSIVQGFVKSMGGFISFESTIGEGTKVMVSIPQHVEDATPCISLSDPDALCMAGFIRFVTIPHPVVRENYNRMVRHLSENLHVPFHWVDSFESLEKLQRIYRLTHLIVGESEYEEHKAYLTELSREIEVMVFADRDYEIDPGSSLHLLKKPLSPFSIMSFRHRDARGNDVTRGRMVCKGVRALVVDDEPMNIFVAKDILEGYGMEVFSAESGEESIRSFEKTDYDIIFMDHMMPGMDGIEAMKRIRAIRKESGNEPAIVALTANAVSAAKEMFLREGFDGFIPKPIEIPEFERVLKHVLPKGVITYEDTEENRADNSFGSDEDNSSAGDEGTKTAGEDKYDPMRAAGVDIAVGMNYCRGEADFFDSMLMEYAKSHDAKIPLLTAALEERSWSDYAIHAHAVKSTSKMIGATDLFEIARSLEDAGKNGDAQGIEEGHDRFIRSYNAVYEAIRESLGIAPSDTEEDDELLEFGPEPEDEILEFAPEEDDNV